jgi:hypothetical protein
MYFSNSSFASSAISLTLLNDTPVRRMITEDREPYTNKTNEKNGQTQTQKPKKEKQFLPLPLSLVRAPLVLAPWCIFLFKHVRVLFVSSVSVFEVPLFFFSFFFSFFFFFFFPFSFACVTFGQAR